MKKTTVKNPGSKTSRVITEKQFDQLVDLIQDGYDDGTVKHRPNPAVGFAINLESNLGIRISDVLKLRLCDIVKDGNRYRLDIVEQKTGKARKFTVEPTMYFYVRQYAEENDIAPDERLVPMTVQGVNKIIREAAKYLELEHISTHSFRKLFATNCYNSSGHDIAMVSHLMQHSSASITQRYIGIDTERAEEVLSSVCHIR